MCGHMNSTNGPVPPHRFFLALRLGLSLFELAGLCLANKHEAPREKSRRPFRTRKLTIEIYTGQKQRPRLPSGLQKKKLFILAHEPKIEIYIKICMINVGFKGIELI